MCKDCFERWHQSAKYYPEDVDYEKQNFQRTQDMLEAAGF
jgi:hypothetical protein